MAERWAVANGNWSSLATWNGGASLPASGDDVYANNFTVTVDQNVTVNSLRIEAGTTAVQGGGFTCGGTYNISVQSLAVGAHTGSSSAILTITAGSPTLAVAIAASGDTSVSGNEPPAVLVTGGALTFNGDALGGSVANGHAIVVSGATAQMIVNGTLTGGSAASVYAVNVTGATAQLTVNGEIVGGSGLAAHGVYMTSGFARIDALLTFGSAGSAPIQSAANPIMFKRTGTLLAMQAPSDDGWPAATGAAIIVERYTTGNPLPADVRDGTLYGPGGTSEGTLAVPPAASVAAGVPVDDTVGTAALSLSDLAAVTGAQIAAAVSA